MIVLATGAHSLARLMQADRDRPQPEHRRAPSLQTPPPRTAGRA